MTPAAELARRGVNDHRRALAGWCVGTVLYVLMIAAIFPSLKSSGALDTLAKNYPDAFKAFFGITGGASLSTGPGFLDTELFSFMLPLLVLVLAVGSGAREISGEEDAGRLELILAYPVRRRAAVLAKGAAVAAGVVAVAICAGVALLVFDPVFGLDLPFWHVVAASLDLTLLGLFFGWLALAVGAAVGKHGLAVALPAGLAAGSFLVSGLHSLAGWLDPFRFLSVFWWLGTTPLQDGSEGWGVLVAGLAAVAALLAGAALIDRRDLEAP